MDAVFTDSPDAAHVVGYGVMLDDSVDRLSVYMKPSDIGIWHGHDDPTCAYVGGISRHCTCAAGEQQ